MLYYCQVRKWMGEFFMNKKVFWMTKTGTFIGMLIALQLLTAPLGNTLITGSLVNLILVVAVMTGDLSSGITVAALSPIFAKFIGIGPLWSIIPFIVLGNIVFVLIWHVIGKRKIQQKYFTYAFAGVSAAIAKFLVLYIGVVRISVPLLLSLPEPQAAVISTVFSVPQLITALIGGALAMLVVPTVELATKASPYRMNT